VARKLREQGSLAGAVQVFIATSPYRRQDRQHAPSTTLPLIHPTSDTRVLISAVVHALRSIFRPGHHYVKAGVMLVDLSQANQEQATLDLFEAAPVQDAPERSRASLMDAMDALNQRFGRNAVTVASAMRGAGPSAHASRQERRSPRFTTRLEEIAIARA
jgi:DNA polymerase V